MFLYILEGENVMFGGLWKIVRVFVCLTVSCELDYAGFCVLDVLLLCLIVLFVSRCWLCIFFFWY